MATMTRSKPFALMGKQEKLAHILGKETAKNMNRIISQSKEVDEK